MICPYCGNETGDGNLFCEHCGQPLATAPANPTPAPVPPANAPKKSNNGVKIGLIVLACLLTVLLIVGGVVLIVIFSGDNGSSEHASGEVTITTYRLPDTVFVTTAPQAERTSRTTRTTRTTTTTTTTVTTTRATTAPTAAPTTGDFIFPDSDRRHLRESEYAHMDADTLMTAINEIYARHGRRFNDQEIQAYFDAMSWYHGTVAPEAFDMSVFNEYENANLERLIEAQRALNVR